MSNRENALRGMVEMLATVDTGLQLQRDGIDDLRRLLKPIMDRVKRLDIDDKEEMAVISEEWQEFIRQMTLALNGPMHEVARRTRVLLGVLH